MIRKLKGLAICSAFVVMAACGVTVDDAESGDSRTGEQYDLLARIDLGGGHDVEIREYAPGEVAIVESGTLDHVDVRIAPHLDLDVLSLEDVYEAVQGVPATGSTAQSLRDAQARIDAHVEARAEVAPTSLPDTTRFDAEHAGTATGIASTSQALIGQPCSPDIYGDAWGADVFRANFCRTLSNRHHSGVIHCVTNFGGFDSGFVHYPRWLDYFIFAADYTNDASTQIWKWKKINPILNQWDWDLTNWDIIPARSWRHYNWKGDAWRHITAKGLGQGSCRIHASVHVER